MGRTCTASGRAARPRLRSGAPRPRLRCFLRYAHGDVGRAADAAVSMALLHYCFPAEALARADVAALRGTVAAHFQWTGVRDKYGRCAGPTNSGSVDGLKW